MQLILKWPAYLPAVLSCGHMHYARCGEASGVGPDSCGRARLAFVQLRAQSLCLLVMHVGGTTRGCASPDTGVEPPQDAMEAFVELCYEVTGTRKW